MRVVSQVKDSPVMWVELEVIDFPARDLLRKYGWAGATIPGWYDGTSRDHYLAKLFVDTFGNKMLPLSPMRGKALETRIKILKADASKFSWRIAATAVRFDIPVIKLYQLINEFTTIFINKTRTLKDNRKIEEYINVAAYWLKANPNWSYRSYNKIGGFVFREIPLAYKALKNSYPSGSLLERALSEIEEGRKSNGYGSSSMSIYPFSTDSVTPRHYVKLIDKYSKQDLAYLVLTKNVPPMHLVALTELGFVGVKEVLGRVDTIPEEWLETLAD